MIPTSLEALEASELLSRRGQGALRRRDRRAGPPRARGRVDRRLRLAPLRAGGVRGARRAADDRHLRRRRRQLSLQATFPQLRVLELEHGSLLRGLSAPPPSDFPPFVSLRDGMGALVSALRDSFERTQLGIGREAVRVLSRRRRLHGRARGRRDARGRRRRARDAGVRDRGASRRPRPGAGGRARGDPVRVVGRRHARASRGPTSSRSTATATSSRVPRAATCSRAPGRRRSGRVARPTTACCSGSTPAASAGATSRRTRTPTSSRSRVDELAFLGVAAEPVLAARPPLAAGDAAVRARTSGAARADRRRARRASGARRSPARRTAASASRTASGRASSRPSRSYEPSPEPAHEPRALGGALRRGARSASRAASARRCARSAPSAALRSSSTAARARTSSTSTATATSTTSSRGGR